MRSDLETQHLLEQPREENQTTSNEVPVRKNQSSSYFRNLIMFLSFLTIITGIIFLIKYSPHLPAEEQISKTIREVSSWEIENIHLDGWTDGNELNNDKGKFLQITVHLDYRLDYENWLNSNDTGLSIKDKKKYRFISERLIKKACFNINNLTTFDGSPQERNLVGLVNIKEPLCVDLQNNVTTHLDLTFFLEPNMDNVLRILKKIWSRKYDELDLSSLLDITLMKQTSLLGYQWNFRLARLRDLKINWNTFINWDDISTEIENLRPQLTQLSVKNFSISDSTNGFQVRITADPIHVIDFLGPIKIPADAIFPLIDWDLRLPNCYEQYTIELPNVFCFTDTLEINSEPEVMAYSDIEGPLPASLMSEVCWSDEENAVTPMTNLINKVFNSTELISMEVKGHAAESDPLVSRSIIPLPLLNRLLDELAYFPVKTNFTLDSDRLIQDVTVNKLKIKWVGGFLGDKRLSVVGRIVAMISLPFYKTNMNHVLIQHMKGNTFLYHDGICFLAIPMKYWTKAVSQIFIDERTGLTLIEVSFEINDSEVKIENSVQLTRVLNEIILKGSSEVNISSNLDIILSSPLGDIALLGLNGKGTALVHS